MPRSSSSPARRHWRSIAAAISGLAIGVAGVGAAVLPAVADPAGGGDIPPAAAAPAAPATAGGSHTVTLITGDRVTVTDLSDGTHAVEIEPAEPGAGIQTVEVDGDLHVMPASAMPYLAAGVVDRDLFNVSQLIEFGYDDASVDATPVIIELEEGAAMRRAAPLPGLALGTPLESIDGAAAAVDHAHAADMWAALTDAAASGGRAFSADPDADEPGDPGDPADVTLGGGIEAIHLDGKVQATLDSSVAWIGAPEAWADGYTGEGVTVAVLDSGYDDTHPDLAGRVLADSTSFVPGEEVADDPHGHGTHVASTIAGTGAASGGTHRGVADGADLLVGKVLGADGFGQDSWIISAMQWAGERADIVSMSLGSQQPSDGTDVMSEALNEIADETGALFVVAAGNSSAPETIGSPGAASSALTVGSVDDPSGWLSWFSSQGPLSRSGALKPDLVGPGSDVTAARSADSAGEGAYVSMSGTSMATPHVAGAAAIVKQQHPEYSADQLRAAIVSTASDVGLTPYQSGSGVVDVDAALDATVIAAGSGDFGMLAWGEAADPVVRTIEYTNRGDAEVVLDLEATLADTTPGAGGGVEPLSVGDDVVADVLAIDATQLTIPAGERRTVTLTADPAAVAPGAQLSGALVASVGGAPVARTALGIIAEAERYDLTVTATGFDGEPIDTFGWIWNEETGWFGSFGVAGETTMRLPAGTYSVMSFLDVMKAADERVTALVGDPDLVLDGDASVAFDARATKPVTVDVGEDGLEPSFRRMDYTSDGFAGSYLAAVWVDALYAQPLEVADENTFEFTTRWRLQHPTLAVTAGKERLDVIPQAGSTLLDGELKARAVDAGLGTPEEFAAVDVAGKVAVVTRSNVISGSERAVNAVAAGAAMLIVVNDADGELSEWVGAPDFTSDVAIPVAAVSGVQGRALLEQMASKKVTVRGVGSPFADEIWDVARYNDGSIPADLDYRVDSLARIDTAYLGEPGQLVGEFRYDFVPNVEYGSGFAMGTIRGVERTEWVNTDRVEWYQDATLVDAGWQIRDVRRAYAPGDVVETSYFGPVVRPYVGPGYWAPNRTGGYAQVNLPSWADGANPERTGAFDVFSGTDDRAQLTEVYVNGSLAASSPYQAATVWDVPDGESEWRVVNRATHDGSHLASSTSTLTEWTFSSTGSAADSTEQVLPMIQAFYDVDPDAAGLVGTGRKKGEPVRLGLELGHIGGASGSAELTGATLEVRIADGGWQPIDLAVAEVAAGASPFTVFPGEREFVTTYAARVPAPDAGAWIDLRVTATDAAGNTFSQEIDRAFEAAPSKGGATGRAPGGRP